MESTCVTKKVFVVEDSAPLRARLLELLMEIDGVHIVGEAETPRDAIRDIMSTLPDYVVLDFQLKGGTGVHILKAVRKLLPLTSFIVLTNHAEVQFRQACADAGANAFFDKSHEIVKVKEMISSTSPRHQPASQNLN